jgi:hypothetical protein
MTDEEVWKDIAEWPGYQVSNLGNVRSFKGKSGSVRNFTPHLNKGYWAVTLRNRKMRKEYVHLLVLEAFVSPRPSLDHEGCHKDGNVDNNSVINLAWKTAADNVRGVGVAARTTTVLTEQVVKQIRAEYAAGKVSQQRLAYKYGISQTQIGRVVRGVCW